LAATPLFQILGFTAYHTSIIIGERELFFDGAGIVQADAFWSHEWCDGARARSSSYETEVVEMGLTELDPSGSSRILEPFFETGTYDVLRKNCNNFSDAALWLLARRRLESKFNRLERWVLALEPVSLDVIRRVLLMGRREMAENQAESMGYVPNPRSVGFNVEDVVGRLSTPSGGSSCFVRSSYCCARSAPLPPKRFCHSSEEGSPDSCDMRKRETVLEKSWEPSIEDCPCSVWDPFDRQKVEDPELNTALTAEDQEPAVPPVLIERLRTARPLRTQSRIHQDLHTDEDVVWDADIGE